MINNKMILLILIFLIILLAFFIPLFLSQKPKIILLSFDTELIDSNKDVYNLLTLLDKYDAKSTFFVMGKLAEENPQLIKDIRSHGHEIACHSYSHPNFRKLNYSEQNNEIKLCNTIIKKITGEIPLGFRAPYWKENDLTPIILEENKFNYDASQIENIPFFWPKPRISMIKASTYSILPLNDYMMLKFFHIPRFVYFNLMKSYPGKSASFAFHPRIIMDYSKDFENILAYWQSQNRTFMTHNNYYKNYLTN